MNIARSTFYYRRKTASLVKDAAIIGKIEEICLEFPGYGYRRVTEDEVRQVAARWFNAERRTVVIATPEKNS